MFHKITIQDGQIVSWTPVQVIEVLFDAPEGSKFDIDPEAVTAENPHGIVIMDDKTYEEKKKAEEKALADLKAEALEAEAK